ncbi:MAG: epoxyqueuosine reductase [Clostridia bacterium]|nr:epoxyqueuosine reductase [Clostridia bacterium]
MNVGLEELFREMKIEYFAVIPYSDLVVTRDDIMKREDFTPRSVIVYLLPYYTGETVNISRYSASLDYHIAIGEVSARLGEYIKEQFPDASFRGYGDHSPIDERHAALAAGLGIAGDSGLLINEKYGTYIFIGDFITDIDPEILSAKAPEEPKRCISCGACREACPTGALRGESPECLSAITQKKGALTEYEKGLMRRYNTAWGCDICQSVCPYNQNPVKTPIEFFYRDRIDTLTADSLSSMSKEEFSKRAFAWRGRKTVERNLEILDDFVD